MNNKVVLKATSRTHVGQKNRTLRKQGLVPAVLYGNKIQNQTFTIPEREFQKLYKQVGESSILQLIIENQSPVNVIIKDIHRNPRDIDRFLHIDFYEIRMDEKIETETQVIFDGEAPAIKELGGVLVKSINSFKIRCLPGDLVKEIHIDLTPLQSFEHRIVIRDLKLPQGIEILNHRPEDTIAFVEEPISEEEMKALEEKPVEDASAVKMVEKKAKETEEEGETGEDNKDAAPKNEAKQGKKDKK